VTSTGLAARAPQTATERRALLDALEDPAGWPEAAAALLAELGFRLVAADRMADDDSHLLIALRERPTLRHFDPESVAYYAPSGTTAALAAVDRASLDGPSRDRRALWGHVHVIDRMPVENRFLTFGGDLRAARIDAELTVVDLWSPAPIVRWGGHSQATDPLAEAIGAFFGRLIVPVDFVPGVAQMVDELLPEVLYRAFLLDALARTARVDRANRPASPFDAWLAAAWARARADRQACTAAEGVIRELRLP